MEFSMDIMSLFSALKKNTFSNVKMVYFETYEHKSVCEGKRKANTSSTQKGIQYKFTLTYFSFAFMYSITI